jgi:signal transduction histidine kinase
MLQNAIKYTEEGGIEVNVSYNCATEKLEWKIKDTGYGLKMSE